MKKLCLVLLALSLVSCATLKAHDPFRNPDGSLNIRKIVLFVSYGIEADCALGQSTLAQDICNYGRAAIDATQAISTSDPELLRRSVLQILEQEAHTHPALQPYVEWADVLLKG